MAQEHELSADYPASDAQEKEGYIDHILDLSHLTPFTPNEPTSLKRKVLTSPKEEPTLLALIKIKCVGYFRWAAFAMLLAPIILWVGFQK